MARKPSPADHEAARKLLGTDEDREAAARLLAPKQGFPVTDVQGVEGYCVQCKAVRRLQNVKPVAHGRHEGVCVVCGAIVFRLLGQMDFNQTITVLINKRLEDALRAPLPHILPNNRA